MKGHRAQVQTEMVEFIGLPFQFSSKHKIWSFHVVVVQGRQRNVQKSVMDVQTSCFAHLTYCFFDVSKGVLDQSERALYF